MLSNIIKWEAIKNELLGECKILVCEIKGSLVIPKKIYARHLSVSHKHNTEEAKTFQMTPK